MADGSSQSTSAAAAVPTSIGLALYPQDEKSRVVYFLPSGRNYEDGTGPYPKACEGAPRRVRISTALNSNVENESSFLANLNYTAVYKQCEKALTSGLHGWDVSNSESLHQVQRRPEHALHMPFPDFRTFILKQWMELPAPRFTANAWNNILQTIKERCGPIQGEHDKTPQDDPFTNEVCQSFASRLAATKPSPIFSCIPTNSFAVSAFILMIFHLSGLPFLETVREC